MRASTGCYRGCVVLPGSAGGGLGRASGRRLAGRRGPLRCHSGSLRYAAVDVSWGAPRVDARMNASRTEASNCVPAQLSSSAMASS